MVTNKSYGAGMCAVVALIFQSNLPALAQENTLSAVDAAWPDPKQEYVQRYGHDLPLWEAGVLGAGYTHPVYPGAAERVSRMLPLPLFIYRGQYLRIDRSTVGVRAIKTPRTEVDVGFGLSLGSRASDIEVRRGMEDLGTLIEFGPRLKVNLGDMAQGRVHSRIQMAMRGVFDADDHLQYRGLAFEPQWVTDVFLAERWLTSVNLGAVLGDQQLVDTFYRVAPSEVTSTRPAYDAKSGLISLRASMFASRSLGNDIRLFSYLRFDSVNQGANYASPLVQRDGGWSAAIGLTWTLAHSGHSAKD